MLGSFGVSVFHWTPAWMTWSLKSMCDLIACIIHTCNMIFKKGVWSFCMHYTHMHNMIFKKRCRIILHALHTHTHTHTHTHNMIFKKGAWSFCMHYTHNMIFKKRCMIFLDALHTQHDLLKRHVIIVHALHTQVLLVSRIFLIFLCFLWIHVNLCSVKYEAI